MQERAPVIIFILHAASVTQGSATDFGVTVSDKPVRKWSRQDMHDHLFTACNAIQFVTAELACVVIHGERARVLFAQPHASVSDMAEGIRGLKHRLRGYARGRRLHVDYVGTVLPPTDPTTDASPRADIDQIVKMAMEQGYSALESNAA